MLRKKMKRRWLRWGSAAALALCASVASSQDVSFFSFFTGWPPGQYELDSVERIAEHPGRPDCDTTSLVRYRGDKIRYARTARVHSAFVPRLSRFESLVTQQAIQHYGRSPRRLRHRGAFNCRIARGRNLRISEHAFGNALDLQGFEFPALLGDEEAPEDMPRRMRRGFSLTILEHWTPRRPRDAYHAQFLHRLTDALRVRPDIFRGIVGPPRPRHRDHLHLDASPWRYAMYAYDRTGE
jgi:hypothetical protein